MRSTLKRIVGQCFSTETYERFVASAALEQNFKAVRQTEKCPARERLWERCVDTIGSERRILMLEFGVFEGYSARFFLDHFKHSGSIYFGFDSFEGLPEKWGTFAPGVFDTGGNTPQVGDARATFVKGWFQNTFEDGLARAKKALPRPEAVFVHFDADLYSSTLFLLAKLYDEFDGYYFLFDEFAGHEARALLNFQQAFGPSIEFFGHTGDPFPEQVFGRLDNAKGKYSPPK